MSQEVVEIVEIADGGVWVEAMQRSACSSCNARSGCGQHSLSKLGRKMRLWVATEKSFQIGQQATLTLPDGSLAMSALALYGIPLIGMLTGAIGGHLSVGEIGSVIGGLAGLVAGFFAARKVADAKKDDWQPQFRDACSHIPVTNLNS